jgi:hypothetical protein
VRSNTRWHEKIEIPQSQPSDSSATHHPIWPFCLNPTKLDEFALRPAAPKGFGKTFICTNNGKLQIDTGKSNASHSTSDHHGQTSTVTDSIMNFVPFQVETFCILNEKYEHHSKIYTDRSKKDEKIRYAAVLRENTLKRRQFQQNLIYSAEQSAIMNAIYFLAN